MDGPFYKWARGCEVHTVVANAKTWAQTGGVDFAIGKFLQSDARRRERRRGGREADGGKEQRGLCHGSGDVGQGEVGRLPTSSFQVVDHESGQHWTNPQPQQVKLLM